MARTCQGMVNDLRRLGRSDDQIRAVAWVARDGQWHAEVDACLKQAPPAPEKPAPEPEPEVAPEPPLEDDLLLDDI